MPAKNGDIVRVHYRGTLDDGTEFDCSYGREPLEFTLGEKTLIAGFEKAVLGLEEGAKTKVRLLPAEAYGEKDPALVLTLSRREAAAGLALEVGRPAGLKLSDGSVAAAVVTAVTESEVTLDANPRLAGEALTFEIEVLAVF